MRWDNLRLAAVEPSGGTSAEGAISSRAAAGEPAADAASAVPLPLPLAGRGATVRTFDTPEFRGVTCYEVRAKSILNRVPGPSRMPFRWTLNPYRACTHADARHPHHVARLRQPLLDPDQGHPHPA
jgi:hypothetical protein